MYLSLFLILSLFNIRRVQSALPVQLPIIAVVESLTIPKDMTAFKDITVFRAPHLRINIRVLQARITTALAVVLRQTVRTQVPDFTLPVQEMLFLLVSVLWDIIAQMERKQPNPIVTVLTVLLEAHAV